MAEPDHVNLAAIATWDHVGMLMTIIGGTAVIISGLLIIWVWILEKWF